MKVVLLAGGLGSRIAEETTVRPKPMIEIGHRPILWHIMQHYAHFGHREFIVCLGYKGEHIKRYFADSLAVAEEAGCDLIFIASHGRRGVAALLLGSETNKVLTHSKIPVLVTR